MPKEKGFPGKRRVQLDLQDPSMRRLEDLKRQTESTTYAEVIKRALRVLEFVVKYKDLSFSYTDENGQRQEGKFLL